MSPLNPLFRREALEHRAQRLSGTVIAPIGYGGWITTVISVSITAVGLGISSSVEYTRFETAPAVLATATPATKILSPRLATVASLAVREGSRVSAGAPIAVLTFDQADQTSSLGQREQDAAVTLLQIAVSQSQRVKALSSFNMAGLQLQLSASKADELAKTTDVKNRQKVVDMLDRSLSRIKDVYGRGFISRTDYDDRETRLLEAKSALSQAQSQLAANHMSQRQLETAIESYPLQEQSQQAQSGLSVLTAERQLNQVRAARMLVIRTPVAGTVATVLTDVGAAVTPGKPIATILPNNSPLMAEAFVRSAAMGGLAPGVRIQLRYDAFPYEHFGSFGATVTSVSLTALSPGEEGPLAQKLVEPSYRVTARLDRSSVMTNGRLVALRPGLSAVGLVPLERHTLLGWLFKPAQ